MTPLASLRIALAPDGTKVVLTAAAGLASELGQLTAGFASAIRTGLLTAEIELDDLLLNLGELLRWPDELQGSVEWQPDLARLAEGNANDSIAIKDALNASGRVLPDIHLELDHGWQAPLTDFQHRDLRKLLSLRHSANFSVPGAGKTRVALALFHHLRGTGEVARALVVAPKSAYSAWQDENLLAFGATPLRMRVLDSRVPADCDLLLMNYERLPDVAPQLAAWLRRKPALLILDEAHRMKLGAAGAWGSACLALGPFAMRRLVLTGTPAPNGSRDLENILGFVWPGQGREHVRDAVASGDLRAASARLRPVYARTKKSELGLPPVSTAVRRLPLPDIHREIYQALLGEASARARTKRDDFGALGRIVLYLLMAATSPALLAAGASRYEPLAYRVPPLDIPHGSLLEELMSDLPSYEMSPKFAEVAAIVHANAQLGRKTLVWSTFVRNLTTLRRLLAAYRPAMVHGGTEDRELEIARFAADPDCFVLLSNPATLGEGISLHHVCHDAVYVDRDFAAGRFLQSLDRIHRLGLPADAETNVTILVSSATIDEVVEGRLAAKLTFMGTVLDDDAVLELADFDEEPTEGAGLNSDDRSRLLEHLGVAPS